MGKQVDANFQDMSVHDKNVAALGPTEEAQDMSTLNRVVVPVGMFTDPNLPEASSASVNLAVDTSPFPHSEDYGAAVEPGEHVVTGTEDLHAPEAGHPGRREAAARRGTTDLPENRDEWQKKHWQARAQELGLSTSGNFDAVQNRVEEAEAIDEEYAAYKADDWKNDIEASQNEDDLAELRDAYVRSGADYSTVADAFDKRQADLTNEQ